jgi:ribokinase
MTATHVVVVGSANVDHTMAVPWLPAPGETVLVSGLDLLAGGKGMNQAVASARLGAHVSFIGAVGDDHGGTFLLAQMRADGIEVDHVHIDSSRRTGIAVVAVLPSGENGILVAPGANHGLLPGPTATAVKELAGPETVVVIQAEIPHAVVESVAHAAEQAGARLLLNLAPYYDLPHQVRRLADPLVVNQVEARALLGSDISGVEGARHAATVLRGSMRSVVITLGAAGACWATGTASGHVPAPRIDDVVDTTGAGDAFVGAMAFALASGLDLPVATALAARISAFSVRRMGAQHSYPSRAEAFELTRPLRPTEKGRQWGAPIHGHGGADGQPAS